MAEACGLILVTGASSYIASHVIQQLQSQGYKVRGTVRNLQNEKKITPIRQLCPNAKHPLELVKADLQDEASWLPAVQGCDYVIHIASPFPSEEPVDENEIIKPAVDGSLHVLKACAKAKCVKRVVLTSSVAAVSDGYSLGGHFDESRWSQLQTLDAYCKSKTLAEMAAWEFVEDLPVEEKFEFCTVNPALVMGPVLLNIYTTSMVIPKRIMQREFPMAPPLNFAIADVRDVATAHIQAMLVPEAAGNRHIISGGNIWMGEMGQVFAEEFSSQGYSIPTYTAPHFFVHLRALFDKQARMVLSSLGKVTTYETARMKNVLGIETTRELKDTVISMVYTMIEFGMIKKTDKYRGPPK